MKTLVFFLSAALTLASARAAESLRIYVIDVEGGGSTLVISPSGQSMLIDSGSAGNAGDRDAKNGSPPPCGPRA